MKKLLLTSLLVGSLIGCQSKEPDVAATQIVAKVNGDEITVHQLNTEMQRLRVPVSNSQVVAKKLLTNLIDRQLLMQEAIKLNLDRSPEVMQLVETARAQIYAQAYLARKVSSLQPATEQEVKQFITEHPEMFNHRKLLATTDIFFDNDPTKIDYDKLQASVNNVEELKLWLNSHQIKFDTAEENIPSEALPQQALSLMSQIKVGDLLFMRDDIKIVARSINGITEMPLEVVQSNEMAIKIVNEHKRQQFILNELKRLKKLARINVSDKELQSKYDSATESGKNSTNATDNGLKGL